MRKGVKDMNKMLIGIVIAIILLGGVFLWSRGNSPQMQNMPTQTQGQAQKSPTSEAAQAATGQTTVTIQNFAFSPATLTVKVGDKVTWTNKDSAAHSATADDGSFDTGVLQNGESGSVTFSKPGTYTYHCSIHPMMKATIVVQ